MDIVIRHAVNDKPLLVLDTKYKHGHQPSNGDVYQMVSYATALGVNQTLLLYPHTLAEILSCQFGSIRCQSFAVPMDRFVLDAIQPLSNLIEV
jgi:5-methylcytosine-specific restriction endonuclease McrBC regulatory subunit McrC